jgi:sugar lactone lactonase YvrE
LDEWSGSLYVTDSVLGVVWKIPADGGTPTSWARGPELQRTALFGANGIAIHRGVVWVSNTDSGTIMEIPIQRDGSAGAIRTAVEGSSGGLDNFVLLGNDDTIIAALTLSNQVVLIDPDGQQQAVLTAADGLSNPTAVAVWYGTLYVSNGAYFTKIDPNLLSARLERRR